VDQLRVDPDLAGEEFLARRLGQLPAGATGAEGKDVAPAQASVPIRTLTCRAMAG